MSFLKAHKGFSLHNVTQKNTEPAKKATLLEVFLYMP